jgi:hypothetical protein
MVLFKNKIKLAAFFEFNKAKMTAKRVYDLGIKADTTATDGGKAVTKLNINDADKAKYKADASTTETIGTSDKFVKFAEAVAKEAAEPEASTKLKWTDLKTIIGDQFIKEKLEWGLKKDDRDAKAALDIFQNAALLAELFENNKSLMTGTLVHALGKEANSEVTVSNATEKFNITNQADYKDGTTPIVTSDKYLKFAEAVATEAKKTSSALTWTKLKDVIGEDFKFPPVVESEAPADTPGSSFAKISTIAAIIFSAFLLFN